MLEYFIKRLLYAIPVLIGVNFITFTLFFIVNTPDDMARMQLGQKHISQIQIDQWKETHGYNKPLFYNREEKGVSRLSHTLFFEKSLILFAFRFGQSDSGRDITQDIQERMWPSLAIALPSLVIGVFLQVSLGLLMAFFRKTHLDIWGQMLCISMISISGLFYIIAGQYCIAKMMALLPISGYAEGFGAIPFIILPIFVSVLAALAPGARWYRTIFLEEMDKDYVRTARAKGLSNLRIFYKHILRNALIPICTNVVLLIPSLFLGSLILESFFGIPGLGSYTIDAISQQDFAVVRSMVFLGSVLYIIGLILTDFSYVLVDPRIRLK